MSTVQRAKPDSFTADRYLDADARQIWKLWIDPERWSEWNQQIASVGFADPIGLDAVVRIRFKRSPIRLKFRIVELRSERILTDEAALPGARLGHRHEVTPEGDGCRVSHRLYLDGALAPLYRTLLGRSMARSVKEFLDHESRVVGNRPASFRVTA